MTKEKTYTINSFKITKVFQGASGVRGEKEVPWLIINFYIDHDKASDKRFTKFVNPNEPENHPYAGAEVSKMEFTEKESGEYTNYTVTNIEYAETQPNSTKAKASPEKKKENRKAPWEEEKAPVKEVIDTAPPKHSNMELLNACVRACTQIVSLYITNHEKGKDIDYATARDQIITGAVGMHNDLIKGLERWENDK